MTMKDNSRKCAKCQATTARDSELVLHRFPKPGPANMVRAAAWARYCYPDKDWSSEEFQKKIYLSHKMLCAKHFPRSAFVKDHLQRDKLHRYAVPSELSTKATITSSTETPGPQPGTSRASDPLVHATQTAAVSDESSMSKHVTPNFKMQCCVPLCSNDADKIQKPSDISFHMFPDSPDMRKYWLDALDLNAWYKKDPEVLKTAVVCSEHFSSPDLYSTKSGFRKLRVGAVPLIIQEALEDEEMAEEPEQLIEQLQVCRICLETGCRLISMVEGELDEVYQNLTGFAMSNDLRLSQTFCPECVQRLKNFDKFRTKSLTADLLISDLLKTSEWSIREEFTKIDREKKGLQSDLAKLFISYDHFDLFIKEDTHNNQDVGDNQIKCKTEMDELTVLHVNPPGAANVTGASIKMDKLTRVYSSTTPQPNLAPKLPRLAPNLQRIAPKLNTQSNLLQIAPKTSSTGSSPQIVRNTNSLIQRGYTINTSNNLLQIAPKPRVTPKGQITPIANKTPSLLKRNELDTKMYAKNESVQTAYVHRQSGVRRNETNKTTNIKTPLKDNQVKKVLSQDDQEQTQVKLDYVPVIDVVIDDKFKIVRKEEILLKNAQIIFNNNKAVVQEMENNKAIIRNKRGIPIGIDLNKGNIPVVKNKQPILPIMTRDRIIMPTIEDISKNVLTPQIKPKTTPIKQEKPETPIKQDKYKSISTSQENRTKQIIQERPKMITTSAKNNKNVTIKKTTQRHMPIIDNSQTEIENEETETGKLYEVPLMNYDEQEYYEESIEETVVTEDYLEMHSDSDNELSNIKKEVEKIIKEEKGGDSNANIKNEIINDTKYEYEGNENENNETWEENEENNETWDETQENNETWEENEENNEQWDENQENNETWDENQDNNETWDESQDTNVMWDENQENSEAWDETNDPWGENHGKWEADDFSEDNEEDQNDENDESKSATEKFDPEAFKKARINRKRRSVLKNYGKAYFSDDLNDVIFSIKQLSFDEQLIEIRNRVHTKFKDAAYSCELCFRGFMNEYAFKRHIELHNEEGDHECPVCKFKFRTSKLLENHVASRHATKFSCNLCSFTTTSAEPARQHGMKHRGIRYQCPDCTEDYLRYTVLMDHMAIKHTPENLCPVCGLKLISAEELERHKAARHRAQCDQDEWDNATHCEKCDILFANENAYRFHLGVSIKHDSEFILEHQKAKRTQEVEFQKPTSHYKKNEVTGPLTCEQCGLKVPSLRKYHAHFRRDHPDKTRTFYPTMKKKVMCELCGKFFKAQWQYMEHLRLHTNERPFSCNICGKAFVTNRLLCAHRYVHGGGPRKRPDIKCKLCGKTFANRGNLHRHMGICTPPPVHRCNVCGKVLANRSNLRRHLDVHSDEKRFKCEICNTAYRQKAEMKSHYDHVHLRKPWPKRNRPRRDGSAKSVPTSEDDTSQQYIVEEVAEEMEIDY